MPQPIRRVALIYDATKAYDVGVMAGVAAYLHASTRWSVYVEESALKDQRLPDLERWPGSGIIANLDDARVYAAVAKSKLPVVGFGSGYGSYAPKSRIPYFLTDNEMIARIAADHLWKRGSRNFAFCGYSHTPINGWAKEREIAFRARLAERNCSVFTYSDPRGKRLPWTQLREALIAWLLSLPKPIGLMAANDNRARQVLEACQECGLRVPGEVAVIGVDNDAVLCQLSSPLLTSIEQGAKRIGFEAAALLNKMMQGEKVDRNRRLVEPEGLVMRLSTTPTPDKDPHVAKAMSFIQMHACDGIKVSDVVDAVGVSRSGLDVRFKVSMARTIRSAIRGTQLERAKILLTESSFAPKDIAARTGFKSVQHLNTLFRLAFGAPPGEYRRKFVPSLICNGSQS